MKTRWLFALCLGFPIAAQAQCKNAHPIQSPATFPTLEGRLVYQAGNGSNNNNTDLYLSRLDGTVATMISSGWTPQQPHNPNFSPDGAWITFTANEGTPLWHVYVWKPGLAQPIELSPEDSLPGRGSEDPKFSFDGRYIVYKHNGDIWLMTLKVGSDGNLASDGAVPLTTGGKTDGSANEKSAPFMTPGNKYVYYYTGTKNNTRLHFINLAQPSMPPQPFAHATNRAEYYPIVRDYTAGFFTAHDISTGYDMIYLVSPALNILTAPPLGLNDCKKENADAVPVDEDYIMFSAGPDIGSLQIYLGAIRNGQIWLVPNLTGSNANPSLLGGTYTKLQTFG